MKNVALIPTSIKYDTFVKHVILTLKTCQKHLLRSVEWVHCLSLFPLVLGRMWLSRAKLGLFLCSLDNLLQKKRNCFLFLEIKFQNGTHLKKGLFLTYFSHFLVTGEKLQKFLRHISHSHTYMYFAHPIDFFCLTNSEKKKKYKFIRYGFSLV